MGTWAVSTVWLLDMIDLFGREVWVNDYVEIASR